MQRQHRKLKWQKENRKIVKQETPAQRLSGIIKSCRNTMRKDKGMNGDGDRLPMLTWIMFLKFLDDNESLQETQAALKNKNTKPLLQNRIVGEIGQRIKI